MPPPAITGEVPKALSPPFPPDPPFQAAEAQLPAPPPPPPIIVTRI